MGNTLPPHLPLPPEKRGCEVQPICGPVGFLVGGVDLGLELGRSFIVEGGVFAVGIVVAFDVVEDFDFGVVGVEEATALKHLELEGADEGLGPSVVVGIGAAGHALAQAGAGQEVTEGGAGVLAAAITMKDDALGRACLEGLAQGVDD